ncbi:MAG: trimeric intracellular cation channel family protein [Synergistaceae bacterium]
MLPFPQYIGRHYFQKGVLVLFSFQIGIISILEYIGVISFAVIGAFTAMQKKMDLFGVSVLAFTAACGGGILRDVIMDVGVPVFFSSYSTIVLVMLSVLFVLILPQFFYVKWVLVVLDAIGLSFFAVDAGIKAINQNYSFVQFVFVAVITAVGGGILRDVLAQRVPVIFRRDIYALAAFAGVICMWFIYPIVGEGAAMKLGLAMIFSIRIISVYFDINLPVLKKI